MAGSVVRARRGARRRGCGSGRGEEFRRPWPGGAAAGVGGGNRAVALRTPIAPELPRLSGSLRVGVGFAGDGRIHSKEVVGGNCDFRVTLDPFDGRHKMLLRPVPAKRGFHELNTAIAIFG
jgi:hypothetical protein